MDQTLGIGSRVEFYAGKGLLLEERFGEIVGTSRLLNGCFEVRWDDGLVSAAPPEWIRSTERAALDPEKPRRGRPHIQFASNVIPFESAWKAPSDLSGRLDEFSGPGTLPSRNL